MSNLKRINKKSILNNMDILDGIFDDYHKMYLDINACAVKQRQHCERSSTGQVSTVKPLYEIAVIAAIVIFLMPGLYLFLR